LRGPSGEEIQGREHPHSPDQAIQKVEHARSKHESKEEQLPLCSHDGEGAIQRPEYGIVDHVQLPRDTSYAEKPCEKIHCENGHSDSENDSCEGSLCSALTKSEGESTDHEGNQC
jgi:hypothetical protein